jgi:hypothetical protein
VRYARSFLRCAALALLVGVLAASPAPRQTHASDPDAVVRQILAGPSYHAAATTAVKREPTLLSRLLDWIGDRVKEAWHSFFRALRGAKDASAAFGIGLIVALLALLVVVVARVVAFFAAGSQPQRGVIDLSAVVARTSAAQWLAQARAAAERGDYGAAIAALFNAALHLLDERRLVPYDPARSPAEYRALVRRHASEAADQFETIARRFLIASFSRSATGRDDYEATLHAYTTLAAAPAAAR